MKTSAIRHPKREHQITVHSWMFKVTGKNLYAANLLAYLEGKFNLMLDLDVKNGGWMKLNKMQIKNGIFADEWEYYNSAIDTLLALEFISVDTESTDEFPLGEYELFIKLDALKINEYLDNITKTKEVTSPIVDYLPYFVFIGHTPKIEPHVEKTTVTYTEINVEQPKQQTLIDVGKTVKKTRTKKVIELDNSLIGTARELFAFWKVKTGHKRSNLQDKFAKQIIDRLKDGYSPFQIAQGIIGLTHSQYHKDNEYDHIQYVVRDTQKLDRMCDIAERNGIELDDAGEEYSVFLESFRSGEKLEYEEPTFKNPITGKELK